MIGNDIVDLNLAKKQSNWRRKGYLDKIFTDLEQNFIFQSTNPDLMVWNLWSRKEAVYKIIIQNGGNIGYYPKKIICLNTDNDKGILFFENQFYYSKTMVFRKHLHTVALFNADEFNKIRYLKNSNQILKINTIPYLLLDGIRYNASKSHHGKFEKMVWLQF